MADHTNTHASPSSPSKPPVPFDDTLVLDSPLVETQLEKLDFDTQVVDNFDCHDDGRLESNFEYEREVVFDSEDESVCRNQVLGFPVVLPQCIGGNKGCGDDVERSEQKDGAGLFTFNILSKESGEPSHTNSLEFEAQFLPVNKMELSSRLHTNKTVREKSLPVPGGKTPQGVAKRMKFRAAPAAKIRTSEWASDNDSKEDVFGERTETPFEFGGFGQRSLMRHQKAKHPNSKEARSSGNEPAQEKHIVNLQKEIAGSTHSDSSFVAHAPQEVCGIEQVSNLNLENNFVERFNGDMRAESAEQELDAPDNFDVGFNTQIAAEAMEALAYGPSSACIVFDTYHGPLNIPEDSLKGMARKPHLVHSYLSKSDCFSLGGSERKTTRKKRTARKRSVKNCNNRELDPEVARPKKMMKGKSLIGEQFNCLNPANSSKSSGRRPTLMVQRQEDETIGRNNEQPENYPSSTISAERISLPKEHAEGEFKSSDVGREIKRSSVKDTLRGSFARSNYLGRSTDDGILKYKRKRSRLLADPANPAKVVSSRGTCSKFCADSSAEVRDLQFSQKELTALTGCLQLDTWSHPKGKRALRKEPRRSKASNIYAPLATFSRNIGKSYYIKSKRTTQQNDKISCYDTETKGKVQPVHHTLTWYSSDKESRKNLEAVSQVASRMCQRNFHEKSGEVNDIDHALCSNGIEKNHKFGVSPNKNLELPVSGYTTTTRTTRINIASCDNVSSKYHKRQFKKNLPKSSLLKELIKLGVPQSIPDLRRRRDMSYVRVLFSQHLDDNIIKQQKKISARLGISIATCPMDATHFIADRFVRTRNMLEAIALGKPVVTHLWLESCGQASCLMDEKNYILRDAKKEKEIGFSMPVSFARARQYPLLEGRRVFITPNIKPPKEMISSLVKAVHGQVVERSKKSAAEIKNNLLIITCDEDHAICVPFLDKGIAAYSSELLLNGIVIQKLELERHQLFKDHARRIKTAQGQGKMSA